MKRGITAILLGMLMGLLAARADAGYLIIRVILEGGQLGGSGLQPPSGYEGASTPPPVLGQGPKFGSGFGPPPGLIPPGKTGPTLPGEPGMPGAPGMIQGKHDPARALVVLVPIKSNFQQAQPFYKSAPHPITNPTWRPKITVDHYGQKLIANLFADGSTIQWYEELLLTPSATTTRSSELETRYVEWKRQSARDLKPLYNLVVLALEIGEVERAHNLADELLQLARESKETLPPEVSVFARVYSRYQPMLRGALLKPSAAEQWRFNLNARQVHQMPHYALVAWDASPDEIQRWNTLLEENFRAFFLLHALRGIELPLPEAPLTVILPSTARDFFQLARVFDIPVRLQTDGFYVPEHDVLVLAPTRLDELGQTFARQMQAIYQTGVKRDTLLSGGGPPLDKDGKKGKRPEEVARMQTLALIERLVEDQAARAAISREGSRQLLYITAQLPRYVDLPEWLQHGSANAWMRPRDPALIHVSKDGKEDKHLISVSLSSGYGVPNYVFQRYFRDLQEKKQLHPDAGQLLRNVLSDAYFRGLRDPTRADDPDPVKKETTVALKSGGGNPPTGVFGGYGPPGTGGLIPPGSGLTPPGGGLSLPGSGLTPPGGGLTPPGSGAYGPGLGGSAGGSGLLPSGSSFGPSGPAAPGESGPPYPGLPGLGTPRSATDDPQVLLRKQREQLNLKAQATAWALYYYLDSIHNAEFRRFLAELTAMPRDLPLEGDTILATFRRVFQLDGSPEADARFAERWLEFIRTVPPAYIDITLVEPKPPTSNTNQPGYPGLPPGYPGLPPGGLGPGTPDGAER
jgi:hypothetical protein